MDGFSVALSEITLVLFTTLAPSGAVAYLLMSLPAVSYTHLDVYKRQTPATPPLAASRPAPACAAVPSVAGSTARIV